MTTAEQLADNELGIDLEKDPAVQAYKDDGEGVFRRLDAGTLNSPGLDSDTALRRAAAYKALTHVPEVKNRDTQSLAVGFESGSPPSDAEALKGELNREVIDSEISGIVDRYIGQSLSLEEAAASIAKLEGREQLELEELQVLREVADTIRNLEGYMSDEDMALLERREWAVRDTFQHSADREQIARDFAASVEEDYGDISTARKILEIIPRLTIFYDRFITGKVMARTREGFLNSIGGYIYGYVLPGEARQELRNALRSTSNEEVAALLGEIREVVEKSAGIFGTNRSIVKEWMDEVASAGMETRPDFELDRLLWNGLLLVDGFIMTRPLGAAARAVRGGAIYLKGSKKARLRMNASIGKLQEEVEIALKSPDPEAALREKGLSTEEVTRVMAMPRPVGPDGKPLGVTPEAPSLVDVFGADKVRAMIERRMNPLSGETSAEVLTRAKARLRAEYKALAGGIFRANMSSFRKVDADNVQVNAMYGGSSEGGFASLADAVRFAKTVADRSADVTFRVFRYTPSGGKRPKKQELEDVLDNEGVLAYRTPPALKVDPRFSSGEYYVQVSTRRQVDPTDRILYGNEAPVMNTLPGPRAIATIPFAPESRFSRSILERAMSRFTSERGMAHQLSIIAKPLYDLPAGSRDKVWRILERGDIDGKEYTWAQLIAGDTGREALTFREAVGYMSYRALSSTLWQLNNTRLRAQMVSQGFRDLRIGKSKERNFGSAVQGEKWLNSPDANGATLWNSSERGAIRASDARGMVQRGEGSVWRLKEPVRVGDDTQYTYIFVRNNDVKVSDLPPFVLKYETGYVPRIAKTEFSLIRNVLKNVNGREEWVPELYGIFSTANKMNLKKEALDRALAGTTDASRIRYEVVDTTTRSLESTRAYRDADILDNPQFIFSDRTENSILRNAEHRELMADPFEAIQRNISATTRAIAWDDLMRGMDADYFRAYGHLFEGSVVLGGRTVSGASLIKGMKDGTISPLRIREYLEEFKVSNASNRKMRKQANEALDLWEYHNMMRGAVDQPGLALWRRTVYSLAQGVEEAMARVGVFAEGRVGSRLGLDQAGNVAARGIQSVSETDPTAFLRSLPFTFFLAGNPTRQLALQTSQYWFAFSANPRAGTQGVQAMVTLRLEGIERVRNPSFELTDKQADIYGAAMGISGRDYKAFSQAFRESGLVEGIDTYNYFSAGIYEWSLGQSRTLRGRLTQRAKNAGITAPHRFLKNIGFDMGETNNLYGTFALSASLHSSKVGKNYGKFTDADWRAVSGQASRMSLSMNRLGQPKYQQGILGITTQFWSIQQKAMFAMMPKTLGGSRAWSTADKWSLAGYQALLYGPHGVGLGVFTDDMFRSWFEDNTPGLDQDTREFLKDLVSFGVLETGFNRAASWITGERVRVTGIAQGFAPAGGLLELQETAFEKLASGQIKSVLLGALGSVLERAGTVWHTAGVLNAMHDEDILTTPELAVGHIKNVLSMYGQFSNATRAYYQLEIGKIVASGGTGDLLNESSLGEEMARLFLGVQTREEVEWRNAKKEMQGGAVMGIGTDAQEIGRDLIRAMDTVLFREALAHDGTPESRARKVEIGAAMIRSMVTLAAPADRPALVKRIETWMTSSDDNTETRAIKILRGLEGGSIPTTERVRRSLNGIELFNANPELKESFMRQYDQAISDVQGRFEKDIEYYDKTNTDETVRRIREGNR